MAIIRYFGAFPDGVLAGFWSSFGSWEIGAILADDSLKIPSSGESSESGLSDTPVALVYHMLSSPSLVRDAGILSLLHERLPQTGQLPFPRDYPPVGLLLLLMDEITEVREWASRQMLLYETAPMTKSNFGTMYTTILELATRAVTLEKRTEGSNSVVQPPDKTAVQTFVFVQTPTALWIGYRQLLRFVPPELLKPDPSFGLDLRQVVVGHLHDTEPR